MKIAALCTRCPVTDAGGRISGLLSLDDLLRCRADGPAGLAGVIRAAMDRELGETPPLRRGLMRIASMGTARWGLPR